MGNQILLVIVAAAVVAVLAPLVWLLFVKRATGRLTQEAKRRAARLVQEAERDSEARLREAEIASKEKLLEARSKFEAAVGEQRSQLDTRQRQLEEMQLRMDKVETEVVARDQDSARRAEEIGAKIVEVERLQTELTALVAEKRGRLEQVSGLTAQQAREELIRSFEDEARIEAAHMIKRIEDEAVERSSQEAQRIIAMAIERSASDYINETTVSVVMLPTDDMKGRIIGREGRNIRALEMATGVDLIVDDTPEAVILSGFDPYRREIARVTLERLIADGRIHPARIEEVAEKVKAEFEQRVQTEGQEALLELNLSSVHPELVKLLGRLRFRTSYGQNVLQHSKEVAFLASNMAAELKANVHVAKRGGLFHDIGKAIDREMEGTHLEIGIELLRKYGETEEVVHAMACHHGDYDPETVEAVLVTASDALSAARPGARREILETYMKRLEKLEQIAMEHKGVQKSYAIQAGREIRIIVDCDKVSDEEALWISKDVAKKIESELTYPGHIKVTVIRESRAVEFAK
jgi:ribonuclease Y